MPPFSTPPHPNPALLTPPHKKQINLLRGWPNPSLLPAQQLAKAAQKALTDPEVYVPGLSYGPDPGYQPLRESLGGWLDGVYSSKEREDHGGLGDSEVLPNSKSEERDEGGEETESEQSKREEAAERICITGGASQNLANVLLVYSDPGVTTVWIVAPCYFMACAIFEDAGLRMRAIGEGEGGIDLLALERGMRGVDEGWKDRKPLKIPQPHSKTYNHIIYCVPTFSNPSSLTMDLQTRRSLILLARKYNALVITDDVYDFLWWNTTPTPHTNAPNTSTSPSASTKAPLPRLTDIDRTLPPFPSPTHNPFGNSISNGSFSKIAGPGVRTGWADASPAFSYGLSQCGASKSGGAPSQVMATVMDGMVRSGDLGRHVEWLRGRYRRRWEGLVGAIEEYLEPLGVVINERKGGGTGVGKEEEVGDESGEVFGGYFVWVDLPEGVDAETVCARAKETENLIVAPGRIFEVRGDESIKFPRSLRFSFAWEEEEDLKEGVERLGRVIREVMDGKGGNVERDKVTEGDFGEFK